MITAIHSHPDFEAVEHNKQLYQEAYSQGYDKELSINVKINNAQILYKNPESRVKSLNKQLDKILTDRLWLSAKISECKKEFKRMSEEL